MGHLTFIGCPEKMPVSICMEIFFYKIIGMVLLSSLIVLQTVGSLFQAGIQRSCRTVFT